jgi:hypothetical protein
MCEPLSSERSEEHPITYKRAISSAGRAPALQAGCRQFDPVIAHHNSNDNEY